MGKNTLFISDLDGTLLHSSGILKPKTIEIVNQLIENGVNFTIATARALESATPMIAPLNLKIPLILQGGVRIYDPVVNNYIKEFFLDRELTASLIELVKNYNIQPILYALDEANQSRAYYTGYYNPAEEFYFTDRLAKKDPRFEKVDKLSLEGKNIMAINIIAKNSQLRELKIEIERNFDVATNYMSDIYTPGYYWLEINNSRATKKEGVNFLRNLLEVDEIIVFGDNHNDISLFEAADKSYAVNNAVNELKFIASDVIGKNDEDGVATFLQEYFNVTNKIKQNNKIE